MSFDFGSIGGIVGNIMDSDRIDIGREEIITLPDGSQTVTDKNTPKYTDVPCHISSNETPNPDPVTAGTTPIIISVTINCSVDVDLQNADRIWARKLSHLGQVLETYQGTIGVPVTQQSRKSAIMEARQAI